MLVPVKIIQFGKIYVSELQNLRTVFNTLSEDDKYCLLYNDNLLEPIQILLSQKQNTFSEFFSGFLKSTLISEHFQKKINLIADVFPKLPSAKKVIR